MSVPTFSLRAAAALFLERQHLDRPRGRRLTANNLSAFVQSTGGLQLDSINVIERAHYLTAWSRFGEYDRAAFDRLVYRRRVLFEYWAHAACLVATEHFPAWRRAMLDYRMRRDKGWGAFLKKHGKVMAAVEQAIAERGPLGNADFAHRRAPGDRGGWWSWKPATHALDFLWMSGRTTIARRVHFHKRFDLMERVMAEPLTREPLATEAFRRWHLTTSLRAMGVATEADLSHYLTFPRLPVTQRPRVLRELLREGVVVEIAVDGARGRWYALRDDLDALSAAGRRRQASRGATFLTPFDSFLWYRDRTLKLFGFDYRIEVYVPEAKRKHGYYTLPILVNGQLIGRVDVKNHRDEGRVELKHVSLEPWLAAGKAPPAAHWGTLDRDRALAGIADAAHSLARFLDADEVTLARVTPAALRVPLQKALASDSAPVKTRATKPPPIPVESAPAP